MHRQNIEDNYTQEIQDKYLTKSFGVRNFGNASAMRVIILWTYSKFNVNFENAQEIEKNFPVSEIKASQLVVLNSLC